MTITFLKGNLLDDNADILVNPVNCIGVMGKGLALQFKERFPNYYSSYVERCRKKDVNLGTVSSYLLSPSIIINFPTKYHWKDKSDLYQVEKGLANLVKEFTFLCELLEVSSIAIPALGCGEGGLAWEDVKPLLENFAEQVPDLDVRVYLPH